MAKVSWSFRPLNSIKFFVVMYIGLKLKCSDLEVKQCHNWPGQAALQASVKTRSLQVEQTVQTLSSIWSGGAGSVARHQYIFVNTVY